MTTLGNRPNTALLVVDRQNGVLEAAHERAAVVANVGRLVEKARRERVSVVWVQHSDERLARGSDGWQTVPELTPGDTEALVEKNYDDSFDDSTLGTVLSRLGVGRLVVVSAETDACIHSTLHGAIVRGYDATLWSATPTRPRTTRHGERRRRIRSSRTRTFTGRTRRRRDERPGRSKPRTSTSAAGPEQPMPRGPRGRGRHHDNQRLSCRMSTSTQRPCL
jgi:nicotinamidase-related amidase